MAEVSPLAGGAGFWLPDEFLDDDFFSEEEKAAVAARSESDEEEGLDGLERRVAGLLLVGGGGKGDDGSSPAKAEVMAGSPQSILCGLAASGEESPNGAASQVSSPPSSPLEQQPADPWDVLHEAAGQVARLRSESIPVPKNAAAHPCSTVLLPARVVQALNLNVEDLGARPVYPGGFALDHDALVSRSNALLASRSSELAAGAVAREVNLPQEWTY
nr:unnamed protein product [Digitaria exilis]